MVGGDVGVGEEALAVADLAVPPVLVGAVRHRDNVAPLELQLALLLRLEVVQRLHVVLEQHTAEGSVYTPARGTEITHGGRVSSHACTWY